MFGASPLIRVFNHDVMTHRVSYKTAPETVRRANAVWVDDSVGMRMIDIEPDLRSLRPVGSIEEAEDAILALCETGTVNHSPAINAILGVSNRIGMLTRVSMGNVALLGDAVAARIVLDPELDRDARKGMVGRWMHLGRMHGIEMYTGYRMPKDDFVVAYVHPGEVICSPGAVIVTDDGPGLYMLPQDQRCLDEASDYIRVRTMDWQ